MFWHYLFGSLKNSIKPPMHLSPHFNTAITIPISTDARCRLEPNSNRCISKSMGNGKSFCGEQGWKSLTPSFLNITISLSAALPGVQQAGGLGCRICMKGQIIRKAALGEKFEIAALRANEPTRIWKMQCGRGLSTKNDCTSPKERRSKMAGMCLLLEGPRLSS